MTKKSGLADSPFFAPVAVPAATESQPRSEANARTGERLNTRTRERANARTGERKVIRHSFNIYEDQLAALRRLVAQKTLQRQQINLSDLVREAIDTLLNREA